MPFYRYNNTKTSQFAAEIQASDPKILNCRLLSDGNVSLCAGDREL